MKLRYYECRISLIYYLIIWFHVYVWRYNKPVPAVSFTLSESYCDPNLQQDWGHKSSHETSHLSNDTINRHCTNHRAYITESKHFTAGNRIANKILYGLVLQRINLRK